MYIRVSQGENFGWLLKDTVDIVDQAEYFIAKIQKYYKWKVLLYWKKFLFVSLYMQGLSFSLQSLTYIYSKHKNNQLEKLA